MDDAVHMRRAMALAAGVRSSTAPNPWVGCVIVPRPFGTAAATTFEGATAAPGGHHAEASTLAAAGAAARGATLYVTLEPCGHHGRTPPCTDAVITAGVARVVVGVEQPDPQVAGRGIAALREAGIEVTVGVAAEEVAEQLAPYQAPHDRAAVGGAQDGGQPRCPHRRPRRHQPLDHRRGRPPGRAPAAGPLRCRLGGGGNRPGGRPRAHGALGRRGRPRPTVAGRAGQGARGRPGAPGARADRRPERRPGRARTARRAPAARRGWGDGGP